MDIESVVLVISVILLFVIGYIAVGVLIPDPRKLRKRRNRRRNRRRKKKNTARFSVRCLNI